MSEFQPSEFDPDALKRRAIDPHMEVLVHKVTRMATDMDKLTDSLTEISKSMNRLVLAEERIATVMASIERVNKRLDDGNAQFKRLGEEVVELSAKVDALKTSAGRTTDWVDKAVLAAAGASVALVAVKSGLLG
jgi:methyl-accepting chemotaxis protein